MKKKSVSLFISVCAVVLVMSSCEMSSDESDESGSKIDSALVGRWVITSSLGGAWLHSPFSPDFFYAIQIFSNADIYRLAINNSGATVSSEDLGSKFIFAKDGSWEMNDGGFGTYEITGDYLILSRSGTGDSFFEKLPD